MGYMASKLNFFPAALHNDGLMDLITMDGDHPPLKMIDLQGKVPENQFFDSDLVRYRKVSAFRVTSPTTRKVLSASTASASRTKPSRRRCIRA